MAASRSRVFPGSEMKDAGVDVVFFATPHEFSRELVPEAIAQGFRVIDLSGAWRLKQAEQSQGLRLRREAGRRSLDSSAVYGLPELHADEIKSAALLANPGCYSTSIILALGALDSRRLRRCRARHHLRFEVRSLRSREDSVREDALRGSRRRSFRVQRFWTPAHGGSAGAARDRRRIAAVYAASAADSARHPLHDLREAGEAGDARKSWSSRCASFMRASRGCGSSAPRGCRRSSFR